MREDYLYLVIFSSSTDKCAQPLLNGVKVVAEDKKISDPVYNVTTNMNSYRRVSPMTSLNGDGFYQYKLL